MQKPLHALLVAVIVVSAGCVGPGVIGSRPTPQDPLTAERPPTASDTQSSARTPIASRRGPAGNYTRLYGRTIDSVVKITARTARGRSQGSGFVYSSEGYIVTNRHVVAGAATVQVRFRDGTWETARVVGTDVYTDLAVIRVRSVPADVDPLPVARSEPRPGQPVVALGSPLGYEGSITHGIISGVNRSMETAHGFSIPDTVQTDAPINPGNSGGPLVSLGGEVVGVNRAKRGDNLGFAISADILRRVVPPLIAKGEYHHPFLGVRTVPVTPLIAEANDLGSARGVMIVGVFEGSPAAGEFRSAEFAQTESGATVPIGGDVITRIEDRRIRSQQALAQYLMLQTRPGEEIAVTVLREGRRVRTTITLERRPELRVSGTV